MREAPPVISYDQPPLPTAHLPAVRFMTLNVAHGRSDGFHQLFQPDGRLIDNLDAIAELMRSERIDVVGQPRVGQAHANVQRVFDHQRQRQKHQRLGQLPGCLALRGLRRVECWVRLNAFRRKVHRIFCTGRL